MFLSKVTASDRSLSIIITIVFILLCVPSPAAAINISSFEPSHILFSLLHRFPALFVATISAFLTPGTYLLLMRTIFSRFFPILIFFLLTVIIYHAGGLKHQELSNHSLPGTFPGHSSNITEGNHFITGFNPYAKKLFTEKLPEIKWKRKGFPNMTVDSELAVSGNRIYYCASSTSEAGEKKGYICCSDTTTGALIWTFDGSNLPGGPLKAVLSSPCLGKSHAVTIPSPFFNERGKRTAGSAAETLPGYLVVGERFPCDCGRVICLDLKPTYSSGEIAPPALKWSAVTASGIMSSPCIFEGKVYVSCGRDGFLSIELETGQILWRRESTATFRLVPSGGRHEFFTSLEKLNGQIVSVSGIRIPSIEKEDNRVPVFELHDILSDYPASLEGLSGLTRVITGKITVSYSPQSNQLEDSFLDSPTGALLIEQSFFDENPGEGNSDGDSPPEGETFVSEVKMELSECFPEPVSTPVAARVADSISDPSSGEKTLLFLGLAGEENIILALDPDRENEKTVWKRSLPFPITGTPSFHASKLYIPSGNGSIHASAPEPHCEIICLSAIDGTTIWTRKLPDSVKGLPVRNNHLYACCRDGNLYVLSTENGDLLHIVPVGSPSVCFPAVTETMIYLTSLEGELICIDRHLFKPVRTYSLTPGKIITGSPVLSDGLIFVPTPENGLIALEEYSENSETVKGSTAGMDDSAAQKKIDSKTPGHPALSSNNTVITLPESLDGTQPVPAKILSVFKKSTPAILWSAFSRDVNTAENTAPSIESILSKKTGGDYLPFPRLHRNSFERAVPVTASEDSIFLLLFTSEIAILAKTELASGEFLWQKNLPSIDTCAVSGPTSIFCLSRTEKPPVLLESRSMETGNVEWRIHLEDPAFRYLLPVSEGLLIAGGLSLTLKAFEQKTGNPVWTAFLPGPLLDLPAEKNGLVAITSEASPARLSLLETHKGRILWTSSLCGRPVGSPCLENDRIFLAFDDFPDSELFFPSPDLSDSQDRNHAGHRPSLAAFSVLDGTILWVRPLISLPSSQPVASPSYVAVPTLAGVLQFFLSRDGTPLHGQGLPLGAHPAPPAVTGNFFICGADNTAGIIYPPYARWLRRFEQAGLFGRLLSRPLVTHRHIIINSEMLGLVVMGETGTDE